MNINDQTILITGASKGIGKAIAIECAKNGANVIINYNKSIDEAKKTASEVEKLGRRALLIKADIKIQSEVDEMFLKIKQEFNKLDAVINNAGLAKSGDPLALDILKSSFEMNLLAQARVIYASLELMKKGKIIFISSIHGRLGHGRPSVIAYSAIKAALDSYMKNLAKHLAPDILVNSIAPGRTLTPGWGEMTKEELDKKSAGHLINRWIEPEEVARAAIFLLENDAVCGEVLTIDGGMSLKTLG